MKTKRFKATSLKRFFCSVAGSETKENLGLYTDMLGIKGCFEFILSKNKVTSETEFDALCTEAESLLLINLTQLGLLPKNKNKGKLVYIDEELINYGMSPRKGAIGSMTIIADDDGKIQSRFHRLQNDYWDGYLEDFPEAETEGKWKHEIFFPLLVK